MKLHLKVIFVCITCASTWLPRTTGFAVDFTLREELGRKWTNECVTFPLTKSQLTLAKENPVLLGPDGPAPWQLISGGKIAFQLDLKPYETAEFHFAKGQKSTSKPTRLKLEESDRSIRVTNEFTGLELARNPAPGKGPILGFRINSGKWIGKSILRSEVPATAWKIDVVESGKVLVEIAAKATFGESGSWETRYRIYANEPVALIDESFSLHAKASHRLVLDDRFQAEELFCKAGQGRIGRNLTWKIEPGDVFTMEPWLRWWMADRQGSTFSLFSQSGNDLLMVGAREAGSWVDPSIASDKRTVPAVFVKKDEDGLHADFPLAHGRRKWMLAALDRKESLSVLKDKKTHFQSPLPYRYLVKHGHFPLDLVKDFFLRWKSNKQHPSLLLTPRDVKDFQVRSRKSLETYLKQANYFLRNPSTMAVYRMDEVLPSYLATRHLEEGRKLGTELIELTLKTLESAVSQQIDQNGVPYGCAPHHHKSIATGIGMADAIMDSPLLSKKDRDRIYAMASFLGYATSRPEYWSPERGFRANPNMTTTVYGYRARIASFVSDHPRAKEWVEEGMNALRSQLRNWSDENGGWLEAPHYAMVSYDEILGMLVMAMNAGFNDWLYTEPKVKKVIRWFAKIATPPDSRIGGFRHHPPIGNTYVTEPCGEFGILAYLFRKKDPAFSSEMQWMFQQQNQYGAPGIGGFFPSFAGYRRLLTNPDLAARAPAYASELFPETGAVLRDHYPSARETYLHLVHGKNHDHYDFDSGSIVLWGKGRVLANDFGYNGRAPQDQHNMVSGPRAPQGIMEVTDFAKGELFDYVSGSKGDWKRQIVLVKGKKSESPTYFVMRDSLKEQDSGTWRLWLTADEVRSADATTKPIKPAEETKQDLLGENAESKKSSNSLAGLEPPKPIRTTISGNSIIAVGREDVDLDLFFLVPKSPNLTTHRKSIRSGSGMKANWNWGPMTTTQTALISTMEKTSGWNVVLFPRMKSTKRAKFESLSDGKGVRITHGEGVDYVFLSPSPFEFKNKEVDFRGRTGVVQMRGGETRLAIHDIGRLEAGGKSIKESN